MKLNTYRFENDYGVCTCVDGTIFKFDIDDFDRISAHTWRKTNKGTIITYIRKKRSVAVKIYIVFKVKMIKSAS